MGCSRFFLLQVAAVPAEEDPDAVSGPLPGGCDQDPGFQEALRRGRTDRAGGLERTAQAALRTPVSPGK